MNLLTKPRFEERQYIATMLDGEQFRITTTCHAKESRTASFKRVKSNLQPGVKLEAVTVNNFLYFWGMFSLAYLSLAIALSSLAMVFNGLGTPSSTLALPFGMEPSWFEMLAGIALTFYPVVPALAFFNRRKYA